MTTYTHKRRKPHKLTMYVFLPLLFLLFCMGVVVGNKDFLSSFFARGAIGCPAASTEQYGKRGLNPPDLQAESNPEIVLAKRGFGPVSESLSLVSYGHPQGEPPDTNAPQLGTMLGNGPQFNSTYRVHTYDWANNRASSEYEDAWPVSLLGLSSLSGQSVYAPKNGYNIGGGYQYMLIYASPTSITMNVIGDDNAIEGYAIHIDGFCVDPNLVALYRQLHSGGRRELPAIHGGQKIGIANGNEVRVAMRDSGAWLDPRSRGDWWQDASTFPNPTVGGGDGGNPTTIPPTPRPTKKPKNQKPSPTIPITVTAVPPSPTLPPGVSPSITPIGFIPSVIPSAPAVVFDTFGDNTKYSDEDAEPFTFFQDARSFIGDTIGSLFGFFKTVAP